MIFNIASIFLIKEKALEIIRQEWFWAFITVLITVLLFAAGRIRENRISIARFIYDISKDFSNNNNITKAYNWIIEYRKAKKNASRCTDLSAIKMLDSTDETRISYADIDTYLTHFEAVFASMHKSKVFKIDNISDLFQQRFFIFIHNPVIQRVDLFEDFEANKNIFLLYREWIATLYKKYGRDNRRMAEYLRSFMCGSFEYNELKGVIGKRAHSREVRDFIFNYVEHICDPDCLYGFYRFKNKNSSEKVMRIVKPCENDINDIMNLQNKVLREMKAEGKEEYFIESKDDEIEFMINNPSSAGCLQVIDDEKTVAFAGLVFYSNDEMFNYENIYLNDNIPEGYRKEFSQKGSVLDTVFVDSDYRGYGIQSVLIKALCGYASDMGKTVVAATVHPENERSKDNFKNNGFNILKECKTECITIRKSDKEYTRNIWYNDKINNKDTFLKNGIYTVYPYLRDKN